MGKKMIPTHIPILIMCAIKNPDLLPDLIRTNLGPLLDEKSTIHCSNTGCDVYVPYRHASACCKQLKETFTVEEVESTEIRCLKE